MSSSSGNDPIFQKFAYKALVLFLLVYLFIGYCTKTELHFFSRGDAQKAIKQNGIKTNESLNTKLEDLNSEIEQACTHSHSPHFDNFAWNSLTSDNQY